MKKIGIYGGTFNPIHNGHINIVNQMAEKLNLDLVLIVPANVPPHKLWMQILESKHRYKMCEIAFETNKIFRVSDIEIRKKGRSYTMDTLNEISNDYKDSRLYLIMGSDSFLSIIKWVGFEEIIKNATLCAAPRDENEANKILEMEKILNAKGAKTKVFDIKIIKISSTDIRNRIFKGVEFEDMVPKNVASYIKENKLYIKEMTE